MATQFVDQVVDRDLRVVVRADVDDALLVVDRERGAVPVVWGDRRRDQLHEAVGVDDRRGLVFIDLREQRRVVARHLQAQVGTRLALHGGDQLGDVVGLQHELAEKKKRMAKHLLVDWSIR